MDQRVIALANQKGGVGKTTASINLASIFASKINTLLVDMDPQGNASEGVGIQEGQAQYTVAEVLKGECRPEEAVINTDFGNLAVLPADIGLAGLEATELEPKTLARALKTLGDYPMIIIDCPPSLSRLTICALAAANRVLVPVKPGKFSLKGLQQLFNAVESLRIRGINPGLRVLGIFYNEVQQNTNLFKAIDGSLKKLYADLLMDTIIPSNVRIGESQIVGEPVAFYDRSSKGYEAYFQLTGEVLEKWERVVRVK